MHTMSPEFEEACAQLLDKFFESHPDDTMQARARKALRLLRASGTPLTGKPEGWAAGILYG